MERFFASVPYSRESFDTPPARCGSKTLVQLYTSGGDVIGDSIEALICQSELKVMAWSMFHGRWSSDPVHTNKFEVPDAGFI
jgi:hypothetical protein